MSARLLRMADEGMSEDEAQALASVVRRQTDHDVEVLPEDECFVVEVRRARPGDSFNSGTHRIGSG